MFNLHIVKKKQQQQKSVKQRQKKLKNWVEHYYHDVRPTLLDKYNKRINSFIRRMQQDPELIKNQDLQTTNINKLFRNVYQKDSFVGDITFKFKDAQDWGSILTPAERLQRKKNMKIFEQKYGDANLAYRSIGSQSEYNPKLINQFRVRNKTKQINPPMKYINKIVNFSMQKSANRKARKSVKNGQQDKLKQGQGRNSALHKTNSRHSQNDSFSYNRQTTLNSVNFLQDDNRSDVMSVRNSVGDYQNDQQPNVQLLKQKEQETNDGKMHFKRMIDIELSMDDDKTKKTLKQLLVKCGVWRAKDKRAVAQVQRDKLQELATNKT